MEHLPDETLVADALAGRREAFDCLVGRYHARVFATAASMVPDLDLAQDVAQEALVAAYLGLAKLSEPKRFGAWLRGIARNTARRAVRELARIRGLSAQLVLPTEPAELTLLPHDCAERAESALLVRAALSNVGERGREVLALHYLGGQSYAEIASFLGVTEVAVQGRLQRARREIRKELAMRNEMPSEPLPPDLTAQVRAVLDDVAAHAEQERGAVARLAQMGLPAVEPLCRAVGHATPSVRRVAAHALCRIGHPSALRPILRLLYTRNPWGFPWLVSLVASGKILSIPGVREELLAIAAGQREHEERWWAIAALSHATGDDEAYACLLDVFRGPLPESQHALVALCKLRPESSAELLIEALDRPEPRLRWQAAWCAGRDQVLLPIQSCLRAFGDGVDWWGRIWAGRLVLLHGAEGERALRSIMEDGPEDQRATAALALAPTRDPAAFRVLTEALASPGRVVQWARRVSDALAQWFPGECVAWVESRAGGADCGPEVAWALAREAPPQAEELGARWLAHGTPTMRAAAVRLLAKLRGPGFLPELRRTVREGKPRKAACEAFGQMLSLRDAAAPLAVEMLASEHWTERKAAVGLLRRWGKLDASAAARAACDPHVAVRSAARTG